MSKNIKVGTDIVRDVESVAFQDADAPGEEVIFSMGGSSNLEFGDAAPKDTNKIWINGVPPKKVNIGTGYSKLEVPVEDGKFPSHIFSAYRSYRAATSKDTKVYFMLSKDYTLTTYDIVTKNATNKFLSFPSGVPNLGSTSACVYGNYLYCLGGEYVVNGRGVGWDGIMKVDLSTYACTLETKKLPTPIIDLDLVLKGNIAYLIGGYTDSTMQWSNTIWKVNLDTLETTILPIQLGGNSVVMKNGSGCLVGNDIYIFGAPYDRRGGYELIMQVFHTDTETVENIEIPGYDFNRKESTTKYPGFGDYLYSFGGYESGSSKKTIIRMNVKTRTFEYLTYQFPEPVSILAGTVCNGAIYYTYNGDTIEKFSTSFPLPQNEIFLNTCTDTNKELLLSKGSAYSITMDVDAVYRGGTGNYAAAETCKKYDGAEWKPI